MLAASKAGAAACAWGPPQSYYWQVEISEIESVHPTLTPMSFASWKGGKGTEEEAEAEEESATNDTATAATSLENSFVPMKTIVTMKYAPRNWFQIEKPKKELDFDKIFREAFDETFPGEWHNVVAAAAPRASSQKSSSTQSHTRTNILPSMTTTRGSLYRAGHAFNNSTYNSSNNARGNRSRWGSGESLDSRMRSMSLGGEGGRGGRTGSEQFASYTTRRSSTNKYNNNNRNHDFRGDGVETKYNHLISKYHDY